MPFEHWAKSLGNYYFVYKHSVNKRRFFPLTFFQSIMDFFFNPKGIAVIGATPNAKKVGYHILKNLLLGYKGQIYPVNSKYKEIEGLNCYGSVENVPDPVDLAIIFIPAPKVPRAVEECAARGIPGVMIESAGFAEVGEQGKSLQTQLKRVASETGIRIWGPNCMGLVDARKKHIFSFVSQVMWNEGLLPGKISLIVQSGLLSAGFLIDLMSHGISGISKACSIGNKVDVDECDLLEYLAADPDTEAIALYLESIPEGRRFLDLCKNCKKPIVALKGGKTSSGVKAAMSHTASMAGNWRVVRGALAQAGVIEAHDFFHMVDMARSLSIYPDGKGKRNGGIAIITFSGASGIISSDLMEQEGLHPAILSKSTINSLKRIFPQWMPVSNPIDLWPAIELNGGQKSYEEAVKAVCHDPQVDAIFIHLFVGGITRQLNLEPIVEQARLAKKPIFCWLLGTRNDANFFQQKALEAGLPVFKEISRAVQCIKAVLLRTTGP